VAVNEEKKEEEIKRRKEIETQYDQAQREWQRKELEFKSSMKKING